jgi:ABC-type sulfate transport system substrate-binding protein
MKPIKQENKMGSIVLDLQKDMINANQKVSDLLRKAYVIARKMFKYMSQSETIQTEWGTKWCLIPRVKKR